MAKLTKLKNDINKAVLASMKFAVDSAQQTALQVIYANSKYGKGITKRSTKQSIELGKNQIVGKVMISPSNPRSRAKTSYARALDEGHKLVFFGKPTNRFVTGKHYTEPALKAGTNAFENNMRELMR